MPHAGFSSFPPTKPLRDEGVCPVRGVVVPVCPSPPAPRHPAEVKSMMTRKGLIQSGKSSVHAAALVLVSTRLAPHSGPSEALRTGQTRPTHPTA